MNRWTLSAALVLLLIPSLAAAQATTGEITGRVEDSGGAIVPGVTVSAENRETGYLRYWLREFRPYLKGALRQFSSKQESLTERLLKRRRARKGL